MTILLMVLLALFAFVAGAVMTGQGSRRSALPGTGLESALARSLQEELENVRERLARTEERLEFVERLLGPGTGDDGLSPPSNGPAAG